MQAQEDEGTSNIELWTGGTYKLKVNKKIKVELEQQFRFNDTLSSFKSTFSEVSLRYTLNKYFKLKGSYRFTARNMERNRNRITLHLYYKWSKKKFPLAVQLRTGFQNDSEVWTDQQITFYRNRIKLEYIDFKKVTPFIAFESFYRFNYRNEFRVNRYTAGLGWDINKRWSTNAFYRIDDEVNVKQPERQNIIGLMFIYSMKL
jgi:hypothetical protein